MALAICPLVLNDEVIGYLILVNEKKPRNFTKEEISMLEKVASQAIKIIRPALKMGVEENRDSGKLAVKYLQTESNRAMQEFYFLLLMHIAPYLADLMYL